MFKQDLSKILTEYVKGHLQTKEIYLKFYQIYLITQTPQMLLDHY